MRIVLALLQVGMSTSLNRYPDPLHYDLKQQIAKLRGVRKEQIFLELAETRRLIFSFRIFYNPREDNALITPPTYGMYKVCKGQ